MVNLLGIELPAAAVHGARRSRFLGGVLGLEIAFQLLI
jgi:hypothetical protein